MHHRFAVASNKPQTNSVTSSSPSITSLQAFKGLERNNQDLETNLENDLTALMKQLSKHVPTAALLSATKTLQTMADDLHTAHPSSGLSDMEHARSVNLRLNSYVKRVLELQNKISHIPLLPVSVAPIIITAPSGTCKQPSGNISNANFTGACERAR